jgi:hypothetical protein
MLVAGEARSDMHKRKSHPAKGGFFFQGRIVPTEAKPQKLSEQMLEAAGLGCQDFFQ